MAVKVSFAKLPTLINLTDSKLEADGVTIINKDAGAERINWMVKTGRLFSGRRERGNPEFHQLIGSKDDAKKLINEFGTLNEEEYVPFGYIVDFDNEELPWDTIVKVAKISEVLLNILEVYIVDRRVMDVSFKVPDIYYLKDGVLVRMSVDEIHNAIDMFDDVVQTATSLFSHDTHRGRRSRRDMFLRDEGRSDRRR